MSNTTPNYTWSPSLYDQNVAFVYSEEGTRPIFELLSAQCGERVVDLGCGTGALTLRLQQLVGKDGLVLAIDASEHMVQKSEANGVENALCGDIQKLIIPDRFKDLPGTFDAVFTNATLHWCKQDPYGAVRTAKTLLKPGGRFVGDLCGHMTGMGIRSAFAQVLKTRGINPPSPWFLPQPGEYKKILEAEGFKVEHISLNPHIASLPGSMIDFLRALYKVAFLKGMSDEEAEKIMKEVSDICEFDQKDHNGTWSYLYVPLRFRAIAPM
ncbi:S-adenosyl-L-methionine-dependent methyltransferase [Rhizoctonia solani]|nr:S-adenosyl-L-methionine-dependent methyltransferase [Rhizoctonia solani]